MSLFLKHTVYIDIFQGIFKVGSANTVKDIVKAGASVSKDILESWADAAEKIAAAVASMEAMMALVDQMMAGQFSHSSHATLTYVSFVAK